MNHLKTIIISLMTLLGVFFAACGNDSSNGADSDSIAEVKTIHSLGACKGANEGVTKFVTLEDAYYTCSNGVWETEGSSDSTSGKGESGQTEKDGIQSTSANLSESVKSSSSLSIEIESNSSVNGSSESGTRCDGSVYDATAKTLKDCRDGKIYRTTQIGTQVWMAENLNYETETSVIPSATWDEYSRFDLDKMTKEERVIWYKANGYDKYGLEYEWDDAKSACPAGWHLPNDEDWLILLSYVGGSSMAGGALRSIEGWADGVPAFDCCGFSARYLRGSLMYYYSTTTKYRRLKLSYNSQSALLYEDETNDNETAYVRCLMNDASSSSSSKNNTSSSSSSVSSSSSKNNTGLSSSSTSSSSSKNNIDSSSSSVSSSSSKNNTVVSSSSVSSSSSKNNASSSSSSVDHCKGVSYNKSTQICDSRDGQVYRTTTIDIPSKGYSEVWMAENLNIETENSWCGGGGTEEGDCSVYGRVYTWAASVGKSEDVCGYIHECDLGTGDIRGVCPEGWHLPSSAEWDDLFTAIGGSSVAGKMLKSETGWETYSGIDNNDAYSFSALPACSRYDYGYCADDEGSRAFFWSSTEYDSDNAYNVCLYYASDKAFLINYNKYIGYSVRCLKD